VHVWFAHYSRSPNRTMQADERANAQSIASTARFFKETFGE
jgi:hypothetical protein